MRFKARPAWVRALHPASRGGTPRADLVYLDGACYEEEKAYLWPPEQLETVPQSDPTYAARVSLLREAAARKATPKEVVHLGPIPACHVVERVVQAAGLIALGHAEAVHLVSPCYAFSTRLAALQARLPGLVEGVHPARYPGPPRAPVIVWADAAAAVPPAQRHLSAPGAVVLHEDGAALPATLPLPRPSVLPAGLAARRPPATSTALPYPATPAARNLPRAFHVFAWAINEACAGEPVAVRAHIRDLLRDAGFYLHLHADAFARPWAALRAGLAEEAWAGHAPVTLARAAVVEASTWDDRAHAARTERLFHALGTWLLPLADRFRYELDALGEAARDAAEKPDGRVAALQRFTHPNTEDALPLLVVLACPLTRDALHRLSWPHPPNPYNGNALQPGQWALVTDLQLGQRPYPATYRVVHFHPPRNRAAAALREAGAAARYYFEPADGTGAAQALFAAYDAAPDTLGDAPFAALFAGSVPDLPEAAAETVAEDEHAAYQLPEPASTSEAEAVAWFLRRRAEAPAPETVPAVAAHHAPVANVSLENAYRRFSHQGRDHFLKWLDAVADCYGFETVSHASLPAPAGEAESLRLVRAWAGVRPLPVFSTAEPAPEIALEKALRAWLFQADLPTALATDGTHWVLVGVAPEEPVVTSSTPGWFAGDEAEACRAGFAGTVARVLAGNPLHAQRPSAVFDTRSAQKACVALLQAVDPHGALAGRSPRALARAAYRLLLCTSGAVDPAALDPDPDPDVAGAEADLRAGITRLDAAAWRRVQPPVCPSHDAAPAFASHLWQALADMHPRYSGDDVLVVPRGHLGPGIAPHHLDALSPQAAARVRKRLNRLAGSGDTVVFAHSDHALPGEEGPWSAYPRVPARCWYLAADPEASARPALSFADADALLRRVLRPLLYDAAGRPRSERHLTTLTLCDPWMGTGRLLCRALCLTAQALAAARSKPEPRPRTRARVLPCVYGLAEDTTAAATARALLRGVAGQVGAAVPGIRCGNALLGVPTGPRLYPIAALFRETGDARHEEFVTHYHERLSGGTTSRVKRGDVWAQRLKALRETLREQLPAYLQGAETDAQTGFAFSAMERSTPQDPIAAADSWCAVWFWPGVDLAHCPLPLRFTEPDPETHARVAALARRHGFFHISLEFPEVFDRPKPGFSAVVSVVPPPPRKPHPATFFAAYDPLFAYRGTEDAARTKAALFAETDAEQAWLQRQDTYQALRHWLSTAADPYGEGRDTAPLVLSRKPARDRALHRALRAVRGAHNAAAPFHLLGGAPFADRPYTAAAMHLVQGGGRMGLAVRPGLLDDPHAAKLRHALWHRWTPEILAVCDTAPERLFLIAQAGTTTAGTLHKGRRIPTPDWHAGLPVGRPYARDLAEKINPEDGCMPHGDTTTAALLLRYRAAFPARPRDWGLEAVSFAAEARQIRLLREQGYVPDLLGFYVRGPFRDAPCGADALWTADHQCLPLDQIIEVVPDPAREADSLLIGLKMPHRDRPRARITPMPSTAGSVVRLPLTALPLLGFLTSLPAGYYMAYAWGDGGGLAHVLNRLPVPAPDTLPPAYARVCVRLFLSNPGLVAQRIHLRALRPEWFVPGDDPPVPDPLYRDLWPVRATGWTHEELTTACAAPSEAEVAGPLAQALATPEPETRAPDTAQPLLHETSGPYADMSDATVLRLRDEVNGRIARKDTRREPENPLLFDL